MSTDIERQTALMQTLDIWTSRTPGTWIEDGYCLIDTGAPFAEDRCLEYGCSQEHTKPAGPEGGHPFDAGRECVFLDGNSPVPTEAKGRVASIQRTLQRDLARPLTVGERESFTEAGFTFHTVRMVIPDGNYMLIQAKYLDGAVTIAGVQSWRGIPSKPKGWKREPDPWAGLTAPWPIVAVGLDADGREVAYIMPLKREEPGSRAFVNAPEPRAAAPVAAGGAP